MTYNGFILINIFLTQVRTMDCQLTLNILSRQNNGDRGHR